MQKRMFSRQMKVKRLRLYRLILLMDNIDFLPFCIQVQAFLPVIRVKLRFQRVVSTLRNSDMLPLDGLVRCALHPLRRIIV